VRPALALALLAAGCSPTVGTACDQALATRVAFDETGTPAFGGQAMLVTSCAGQSWSCHSGRALLRYATPVGTDFDVALAGDATGLARLESARRDVHRLRDSIYAHAVSGDMPPRAIGDRMLARQAVYRWSDGVAIPSVRTADGREMLRNWLACGSPVVQGTRDPMPIACTSDADCPLTACDPTPAPGPRECLQVGFVEARAPSSIMPRWSSLYDGAIAHGCAIVSCHDAEDAAASGHLDLSSATIAYAALVGVTDDADCGTRVVPGDPDASVLVRTLEGASCGPERAFHDSPLTATLREWIAAGAAMD
jgi:hypothetical protein